MNIHKQKILLGWIICILFFGNPSRTIAAESAASTDSSLNQEFSDFAGLRTYLLTLIGGATKRIWVCTDFFTDADIVSSLYIAQYRKVQVQSLLGRERATNIMSRLSYLKQVNIPVALRPRNFYVKYPTIFLIDDKIVSINTNLDRNTRLARYKIASITSLDIASYEQAYSAAMLQNDAPNAKPIPQVGRPNAFPKTVYRPKESTGTPIQTDTTKIDRLDSKAPDTAAPSEINQKSNTEPSGTTNSDGSYRYRTVRDKPGLGVPTKLPRTTISQDRERQKANLNRTKASGSTE